MFRTIFEVCEISCTGEFLRSFGYFSSRAHAESVLLAAQAVHHDYFTDVKLVERQLLVDPSPVHAHFEADLEASFEPN
jgi:hypothetical protein